MPFKGFSWKNVIMVSKGVMVMLPEKNVPDVRIPDELLHVIQKTGYGKSIDEKVKLSLSIGLFVEKSVTLERAAELAGIPLAQFIEILRVKKIPWMEFTEEHLEEDSFAIQKYVEEGKADDKAD